MADPGPSVVLVTGIQGAGKSTVAAALADRCERGVHVEGDAFLRMIRRGGARMAPGATAEAEAQLRMRHRLSAAAADSFADAGFTAIAEDNAYGGTWLDDWIDAVETRPVYVVVLLVDPAVRGADRGDGYDPADLDRALREDTTRYGLWLDTTDLSVDATVDAILGRLDEASVYESERPEPAPAAAEWIEANREWWDERVPTHAASAFYDVDGFVADPDRMRDFEVADVGDVTGKTLVHLQCHMGADTLSWATRGARVVGLDFSAPAIEVARRTAARLGYDDAGDGRAEFVVADVYDAPEALGGRTFDVVYTGMGALPWLPDIDRWADVACSLVAPGGMLYVADFHPFTNVFSYRELTVESSYWDEGTAWPSATTYTGDDAEFAAGVEVLRNYPVADLVNGMVRNGLVIDRLGEHPFTFFERWPFLVRDEATGRWELPPRYPRLPLVLTIRARRPPASGSAPPA